MTTPHARFFQDQLSSWPLAATNYGKLAGVIARTVQVDDQSVIVQFNPGRTASTTANISPQAIQARPCFLCDANRPNEQQSLALPATPSFKLLVNPYPVLPRHYTLTGAHQPQELRPFLTDFLLLTSQLNDCVVFYNGPRCGASAPDHLHFQAGSKGQLPLPSNVKSWQPNHCHIIHQENDLTISRLTGLIRSGWLLQGKDIESLTCWLIRLLDLLSMGKSSAGVPFQKGSKTSTLGSYEQQAPTEEEPMVNLVGWFEDNQWQLLLFPRKAHRPSCYSATDHNQRLISPAALEMSGLLVVTREEDLRHLTADDIRAIYKDVAWSDNEVAALTPHLALQQEPTLDVGIVSGVTLGIHLSSPYTLIGQRKLTGQLTEKEEAIYAETIRTIQGSHTLTHQPGLILLDGQPFLSLRFDPLEAGASFELDNVRIGIGFHWERTEKQVFEGSLVLLTDDLNLTAVNRVPLEAYLTSVISSEMSANASLELLKAHAVISRSWLLAQMQQKGKKQGPKEGMVDNGTTRLRWYDREDHERFDVCADDHCQRYQGLTRATNPTVRHAIEATRGLVLQAEGVICDARFSKSCGGYLEEFQHCWENTPKSYLVGKPDWMVPSPGFQENEHKQRATQPATTGAASAIKANKLKDLTQEDQAREWILGNPSAFCNTNDPAILSQVLNHYDQETPDFYRWTVSYTTDVLSELVNRRSGIDFGTILELIPVERGRSGRLVKLKIIGSKQSRIIGKELEIRRTLSESHLYSSAFVIEKTVNGFLLHGAGWGHGVGLCQIGAAVMGEQGYDFKTILSHYYPNSNLMTFYK